MSPRQVLIFPAGTEIGLEVFEALRHCKEVQLHAAGQDVANHAMFAFAIYHVIPSVKEAGWVDALAVLCRSLRIDYIIPAYDDVIVALAERAADIPAKVVSSPLETCLATRSKRETYRRLEGVVRVPAVYESAAQVKGYPVLVKPERGQGSQGVARCDDAGQLAAAMAKVEDPLICEFLPGEEYTVDCFSDRQRGVLFSGARLRRRTRNGISVSTSTVKLQGVGEFARSIAAQFDLRGAWFFQVKRASNGELALLEVAPRIAGSMSAHRMMGINFPLLSIFEHERKPLSVMTNDGNIDLDRALRNRYRHSICYSVLYIDFDDTIVIADKINLDAVSLIFKCINDGVKVVLVTRHAANIEASLRLHRLNGLFDEVIHLRAGERKSAFIRPEGAIFVDDSFAERLDVHQQLGIPTFDSSMLELLLHSNSSSRR